MSSRDAGLHRVESRFEENFAAALIAVIFHRREQQCRPRSVKKTNVSGSILRGREGRYRAVNVVTRVPGVSKGDLLLMAYWNGMSTVIKRDGPTAPWRSPLNVRGYIRARKGGGGRGGREQSVVAGVGIDGSFSFSPVAQLHCIRETRGGSIKIISDALMRNYEGLSFFIFVGFFAPKISFLYQASRIYDILLRERVLNFKIIIKICFLILSSMYSYVCEQW